MNAHKHNTPQRLVWNFECHTQNTPPCPALPKQTRDPIKWERRYFWPDDAIIPLTLMDNAESDLGQYKKKHREDCYYLLPQSPVNIKLRREALLYKPILGQTQSTLGFGAKINLDTQHTQELQRLADSARAHGKAVLVTKDAFIYTFATTPQIKLELARLKIHDTYYFSACIEGHSQLLVDRLSDYIFGDKPASDYVSFLKQAQGLC